MLTKILAWGAGILGFMVLVLRGQLKDAKIKELRRDVSEEKMAKEAGDKATEALVRGLNEESKCINRGYFDNKSE